MIRYLKHKEIDFIKWDNCVDNAVNSLPYCYSWYLDIACEENWNALVHGDYEAIFPLPFKNRIIYKKIYQPFFVQQLGLFYTNEIQRKLLRDFIHAIPSGFKKIYLQLNSDNIINDSALQVKHKLTHHIDLNRPYEEIAASFNSNTKRHLKKANANDLVITEEMTPSQMSDFRREHLGPELKGVQNEKDLMRLERLMTKAISLNQGKITAVKDKEGELHSALFYLTGKSHIIYLNAVSSPSGKDSQAMSFLIDQLLKKYANTNFIFDFEGSMIAGIARYYKGFGAEEVKFPVISR